MKTLDLPSRLIAFGEEPRGERVNVYQKMKTLCGILNALGDDEHGELSRSSLGGLLDFSNRPAFSKFQNSVKKLKALRFFLRY